MSIHYPKVHIISIFRDNAKDPYIWNYFNRLHDLDYPSGNLRLLIAEGDSQDNTYDRLMFYIKAQDTQTWFDQIDLFKYDTGRPYLDYEISTDRLTTLATMYNFCIEEVVKQDWADIMWLLESDIMFGQDFLEIMLELWYGKIGCMAPMVWIEGKHIGTVFYDLWGYRAFANQYEWNEPLVRTPDKEVVQHFPQKPPAWYYMNLPHEEYMSEVAAACCCFLTDVKYLKAGARCTNEDEAAGMQKQIRDTGGKIFINRKANVFHPLEECHLI